MLVWSMRCGSVLLLGLIGIEGTRVFRKNCSVATIRFARKSQFWAYFCFWAPGSASCLVQWAGWPGRGAFVGDFGQRCGRGGLGSAVRGCLWWRNVGGWMPWTTRRREWSGPGVTPLVALETLRVGVWSGAAGRQEVFAVAGVRSRGQVHLLGGILAFCPPPGLGLFRLPYPWALLPSFHRSAICTAV